MIVEEYDESLFISRFKDYKRVVTSENPNGNFTYKGLRHLFNYLDESSDKENPFILDVISICGDYTEWENLEEFIENHNGYEREEGEDDEDYKKRVEEEINNNTTLIKFGDDLDEGFITQSY